MGSRSGLLSARPSSPLLSTTLELLGESLLSWGLALSPCRCGTAIGCRITSIPVCMGGEPHCLTPSPRLCQTSRCRCRVAAVPHTLSFQSKQLPSQTGLTLRRSHGRPPLPPMGPQAGHRLCAVSFKLHSCNPEMLICG